MQTILTLILFSKCFLHVRGIKHTTYIVFLFFCHSVWGLQHYTVAGDSMLPTLKSGDRIAVDSTCLDTDQIQSGALILIQLHNREHPLVKRVVAVPGDLVEVQSRQLKIGDVSHVLRTTEDGLLKKQLQHYGFVIPKNSYIALGDNHKASLDSSALGLISKRQITGCVVTP
ncbi:signal peptidase I [Marinicella sp. W31]|uniref:signal peptidase I n=1 Tax=Marinicella sp. W31 TaxID=3023713 RepID=UPI003756B29B